MNSTQPLTLPSSEAGRHQFNAFKHLFLPTFGLAVFTSLCTSNKLRFLGFLSYVLWCFAATQYTAGASFENYGVGCQLGGACLAAMYNLVLSDPLTEWQHPSEPGKRMKDLPLWKRVYWVLSATAGHRGIDWSFQVPFLPPLPSDNRRQFIKRRTKQILLHLFLADLAQSYQRVPPVTSPSAGVPMQSLWAQGHFFGFLDTISRIVIICAKFTCAYYVASITCVATGVHEPRLWPDIFGRFGDAYTVRRFWSRTWHQSFRRVTSASGKAAARILCCKPGTWVSARVQLIGGFGVSAFAHVPGDMMSGTQRAGASVPFLMWQVLAITLEDFVIDVGKYYGVREGNWVYAADLVFPASAAKKGLFAFSVVRPALKYLSTSMS